MRRNYRNRLDRLQRAAENGRPGSPGRTLSSDPRAVALRPELLSIACRLTPEGGWADDVAFGQAMLQDDGGGK
jgi:hypothetical protein